MFRSPSSYWQKLLNALFSPGRRVPVRARTLKPRVECLESRVVPSYLYVANSGSSSASITGYSIDPDTGALHPLAFSFTASGTDTNSVTFAPSGRFVYATNENDNTISAFRIATGGGSVGDEPPGSLDQIGSPVATGNHPNSATITPSGRFLYTANESSKNISAFSIDASTGALAAIAGSPFAAGANNSDSIAIDPLGRFAYVTDDNLGGTSTILEYAINPNTGALTPIAGSPVASGSGTDWITVDRSGRFVYAANFNDQTVSAYTINAGTGALMPIAGSPVAVGGAPDKLTVDPQGRFLLTANDGNIGPAGVGVLSIDPNTGALTAVAGSPFTAGTEPSGVTVDASGRFVYAANEQSNSVSMFTLNRATGALTPIPGSPIASSPFTPLAEPVAIATTPNLLPPATSVAFGPSGEVLEVVYPSGLLIQYDASGAHNLGGGVRTASVAFTPDGAEVLVVVFTNGELHQFDSSGDHDIGGGINAASVAFGPAGEVLDLVYADGTLYQFDASGAHFLGASIKDVSVAFGPAGEVLDVVYNDSTLYQYDASGATLLGSGAQAVGAAFGPAGEVLDVVYFDDSLYQFDAAGAHRLGTLS